MLALPILLLVVGGIAWRAMSKDQRLHALRTVDSWLAMAADTYRTHGRAELAAFRTAIRARGRWPVATISLAAASVAAWWWMRSQAIAQGDPAALLAVGGNFGPRTSNGEWWRLVTAIFLHGTVTSLIVDVAAFVQVGWTLERIAGRTALAEVFLAGGLFTGLAGLSMHPTSVMSSAPGAAAGVYGLFVIVAAAGWLLRSPTTIPVVTLERLLPVTIVFLLHAAADTTAGGAAPLAGFVAGGFVGLAALKGLRERTPPMRRMACTAAAALIVAAGFAVSLRGILDVRPEIEQVVRLENRTASVYHSAAVSFQRGKMTAADLARMIDRTIVPEFQDADAHLSALRGVPIDDEPRIVEAREYLRLRTESWRLRAEGLRMTDRSVRGASRTADDSDVAFRVRAQTLYQSAQMASGKADGAERASLDAFARLRPASRASSVGR